MKNTEFDKEYYVMDVDSDNHPFLAWKVDDPFPSSDNTKRTKISDTGWKRSVSDKREEYRVQSFDDGTVRSEKLYYDETDKHLHQWVQNNPTTGRYGIGAKVSRNDKINIMSQFLSAEPIDENSLNLPLKIVFGKPYLKQYEMADFLMLGAQYSGSEKLKRLFEELSIYGIQFIPIEIESNKREIIEGYYVFHFWNRLPAIDKNKYIGNEPNRSGRITDLRKLSLDSEVLKNISLENRLVFSLAEKNEMVIVHQSICDAIQSENLTGIRFFRVDDWDDGAIFRN